MTGMEKPNRFSWQSTQNDRVMIFADGKVAKTLRGKEAIRFLNRVERASEEEQQRLMAAATGQFKFGNERR